MIQRAFFPLIQHKHLSHLGLFQALLDVGGFCRASNGCLWTNGLGVECGKMQLGA